MSNRLPFKVVKKGSQIDTVETAGGLATGMKSYLAAAGIKDYVWIGWPGESFDNEKERELVREQSAKLNALPVFLDDETVKGFYNGFCNRTVYPLFSYFTNYVTYDDNDWEMYKKANKIFCDKIAEIAKPGDIVWIHDYHFMLLPSMLKQLHPDLPVGFFLHIPFPAYEIFRLLPTTWCNDLLNGVLGADLIGFHTYDYSQDFLTCISRVLGYENELGYVQTADGEIKHVDTFPMGIDFNRFYDMSMNHDVIKEGQMIKDTIPNKKLIFSIDRLDYTKGIYNRLKGFELYLERNPDIRGKVVLALVVVPSRVEITEYQEMKTAIDKLVGEINGRFSDLGWTPIMYQYKFISFESLIAWYNSADVALITPLRDGMNLVAKEYVASKGDSPGVLILSDMTGAAKELGAAVMTNPNHPVEICEALETALNMPQEEQLQRLKEMQKSLKRYDVVRWGNDFIKELLEVKERQHMLSARLLGKSEGGLVSDYKKSKKALLLLDYDGTLVAFTNNPKLSLPGKEVTNTLKALAGNKKNDVVVISGRDKGTLSNFLKEINVNLIAEHGAWIKEVDSEWNPVRPLNSNWKAEIMPILQVYVDRLPGSYIEEKDFSLVWHYRQAESEFAAFRITELRDNLTRLTANTELGVYKGNKVIEIKHSSVNKGMAATYFIDKFKPDFILAIGDDYTDEDMFKALPEGAYSIRVGMTQSYARFNLRNSKEVLSLLDKLEKS